MAQDSNVRFVRINGRVVPIKQKTMPSASTTQNPSQSEEVKEGKFFRRFAGATGVAGGLFAAGLVHSQQSKYQTKYKSNKDSFANYKNNAKKTWNKTPARVIAEYRWRNKNTKPSLGEKVKYASRIGKSRLKNAQEISTTTAQILKNKIKPFNPSLKRAALYSTVLGGFGYMLGRIDDKRIYEHNKNKMKEL